MYFTLTQKIVTKDGKSYRNFYLVNKELALKLPIECKVFKDANGQIKNKRDFNTMIILAEKEGISEPKIDEE